MYRLPRITETPWVSTKKLSLCRKFFLDIYHFIRWRQKMSCQLWPTNFWFHLIKPSLKSSVPPRCWVPPFFHWEILSIQWDFHVISSALCLTYAKYAVFMHHYCFLFYEIAKMAILISPWGQHNFFMMSTEIAHVSCAIVLLPWAYLYLHFLLPNFI